jgi:hypothetical protein
MSMDDDEIRETLLEDARAREQSERLAQAFAGADPDKLSAALEAGDVGAAQRELGLSDVDIARIAGELSEAREGA